MLHAFSTLGCFELTLPEVLNLAARHGMAAVELRGLAGEMSLPDHLERTLGSVEAAAALAGGPGPKIAALDTSFSLTDESAAARAEFLRHVPWAEAMRVPWLRVFDGKAEGDSYADLVEGLRWWEELRARNGWNVRVMVETHDSLLTRAGLETLLRRAPAVAILWDAHNTWRKGGEIPADIWPAIREHVVHIHVKDSVDRPSARHPFTYVAPGKGRFPMAGLRQALEQDGYAGLVSLEWERKWHPYLGSLEEALDAADSGWW